MKNIPIIGCTVIIIIIVIVSLVFYKTKEGIKTPSGMWEWEWSNEYNGWIKEQDGLSEPTGITTIGKRS